jgi:hypothetical protein
MPFATGTLKGDLLEVRYGDSMQHSDFENAVYPIPIAIDRKWRTEP